jgi:hypothetical protein
MAPLGNNGGLPEKLSAEDEAKFPRLRSCGYRVSSPKDARYNCVAHAAGDSGRRWESTPFPQPGYYWPNGAVRGDTPEALISAFEAIGYERCQDGVPETGYEKVVLYVDDDGDWSHAAKLEQNGEWSSKLGLEEDILHPTEHAVAGSMYGLVFAYLRRRLSARASQAVSDQPKPASPRKQSRKRRS